VALTALDQPIHQRIRQHIGLPTEIADDFNVDGAPGARWTDAATSRPSQFDAFQVVSSKLVAPGTVRDTWGPTDPVVSADYPLDGLGNPYSPWFVTHRLIWFDIGRDDDFEIEVAWEISVDIAAISQVSPCFGIDLNAAADQKGMLYAFDVSLASGVSYWHNVPLTTSVADVFDPTYYEAVPGTGLEVGVPSVGTHLWTVRCTEGTMQVWFDGANRGRFTRPAWSLGRSTVGIHVVGIHCDPDENYPTGLPGSLAYRSGTPGEDPPPVATVPSWRARTW
jgi:hypothetical protein